MNKNSKIRLSWTHGLAEHFELNVDPITALSLAHIFSDAKTVLHVNLSSIYGKATFKTVPDRQTLKVLSLLASKYRKVKDNSNEHLDQLRRKEIEEYWLDAKILSNEEEFIDCDGWKHIEPGDEYSRNYYVIDEYENSTKRRYIIRFIPNSSQVMEEIVRDENGNDLDFSD